MPWAKHWDIRKYIHEFSNKDVQYKYGANSRYIILDYLILRSDKNLLNFVGVERIMTDTGITSDAAVAGALKWLFDRGALYNVPPQYRVGLAAKMQKRKYVFQLTGIINLGSDWIRYLLFSQKHLDTLIVQWQSVGLEMPVTPVYLLPKYQAPLPDKDNQPSLNEASSGEAKVLTGINSSLNYEQNTSSHATIVQSSFKNEKARHAKDNANAVENKEVTISQEVLFNVSQHPLVHFVAKELNIKSITIDTVVAECLMRKHRIQEGNHVFPYESALDMYTSEPRFKPFVKERVKALKDIDGILLSQVLKNIANVSRKRVFKSDSVKGNLPGFHYRLKETEITVQRIDEPVKTVTYTPSAEWLAANEYEDHELQGEALLDWIKTNVLSKSPKPTPPTVNNSHRMPEGFIDPYNDDDDDLELPMESMAVVAKLDKTPPPVRHAPLPDDYDEFDVFGDD